MHWRDKSFEDGCYSVNLCAFFVIFFLKKWTVLCVEAWKFLMWSLYFRLASDCFCQFILPGLPVLQKTECLSVEICSYFLCLVFWCKVKLVVHSQLFQNTKPCKLWYWCEVIPALHNANAKVYGSSWFFWEELYVELILHKWGKKMKQFLIALVKARQCSLIFAFSPPSYTQ